MTLAVRFRFHGAKTPTFDIVELTDNQWREFFWLERSMMRLEWMIHFLNRDYMRHEIKGLTNRSQCPDPQEIRNKTNKSNNKLIINLTKNLNV